MEALPETANTRAFLRKGRYDTTRLSQRRARGPIRRQLAVRCAAQKQAAHPINAVSLATQREIYISQREIRAATCLSNTTAERGRISERSQPASHLLQCCLFCMQIIVREANSSHNWHNVYHAYYSAVYSACSLSSRRAI